MKSINFDEGYKRYIINDDESRVIRINVTDLGLKKRLEDAAANVSAALESIGDEPTFEQAYEVDAIIRKELDDALGQGVCDTVFGRANVLSPLEGGGTLIQSFFDAFLPAIREDIEQAAKAAAERVDKYIKPETGD